jgi:hypothetical protein
MNIRDINRFRVLDTFRCWWPHWDDIDIYHDNATGDFLMRAVVTSRNAEHLCDMIQLMGQICALGPRKHGGHRLMLETDFAFAEDSAAKDSGPSNERPEGNTP